MPVYTRMQAHVKPRNEEPNQGCESINMLSSAIFLAIVEVKLSPMKLTKIFQNFRLMTIAMTILLIFLIAQYIFFFTKKYQDSNAKAYAWRTSALQ